jgi:hypothetical protein
MSEYDDDLVQGALRLCRAMARRECEKLHQYGLTVSDNTPPSKRCETDPCLPCKARAFLFDPGKVAR